MITLCPDCGTPRPTARCPHCNRASETTWTSRRLKLAGAALALGLSLGADGPPEAPVALYGIEPVRPIDIAKPIPPPPRSGADLVEDAVSRMRGGDLDGADALLNEALVRDPTLEVEVRYQQARVLVLRRDYAEGLKRCSALVAEVPGSHRHRDCRFWIAELTGTLGDAPGAVAAFDELADLPDLTDFDQAKIALNRAVFNMEVDRQKKARRKLQKTLKRVEPGQVPFYEAKAWVRLAQSDLDIADGLDFDSKEKRQQRTIARRTAIMQQADAAFDQAIALKEPEWVYAGLLRMAESFEAFGDDLLVARDPDLTPDQLVIYKRGVAEQAERFWSFAASRLEQGISLAERMDDTSARVDDMKRARAQLVTKIDAGAPTD